MTIQVQSNNAAADAQVNKPAEAATAAPKETTTPAPEAEASEQNTTAASETAETEVAEGESEHEEPEAGHEAGEATETTDGTKEEKPGKKKGGFQRRIDKLNAAKAQAQQEAEFWKQQALKGAGEPKKETSVETTSAASEGKPDPDKFKTHAEYVEALTDWKTEQKLKERDQKIEKSRLLDEQTKLANTYQERLNSFKEKTEDFDDVLDGVANVPMSPAVQSILLKSENGPELLYELAKNPKEADRICRLSPIDAAREMGKFEARIAAKTSATKQETKKTSSAPKPLAPVGGGGKASAIPKSLDEAAKSSFSEYKRIREEELKKKRRRA
jgi:hypothetical protein